MPCLTTRRAALSLLGRRTTANGAFLALRRRLPSSLKVTDRGVPRRARRVARCVLVFSPNVSLVVPRRPVRARTGVRRGAHGSTDTTGATAVGIGPGAPLGDGPGMSKGLAGDGSGTTVVAGGARAGGGGGGGGGARGGGGGAGSRGGGGAAGRGPPSWRGSSRRSSRSHWSRSPRRAAWRRRRPCRPPRS